MCLDAGSGRLPSSHPNPRKTKNVGLLSGVPSRRTARNHCRTTPWPCRHSCRRATGQRWRNRAGQGPVLDTRVPSSPPSSTRRVPGMAATGASSTRRSVIVERPIPTMQFDAEGRTGRDPNRNGLKPVSVQKQLSSTKPFDIIAVHARVRARLRLRRSALSANDVPDRGGSERARPSRPEKCLDRPAQREPSDAGRGGGGGR